MEQSPKSNWYLLIFVLIVIILFTWYYLQTKEIEKLSLQQVQPPIEKLEKQLIQDKSLPANFSKDIPLIPDSQKVETYNLYNAKYATTTEGVVVLESTQSPEEIKKFYQDALKAPEFQFVQGSDQNDTADRKVLVYSTATGIVIIKIEKTDTGSKIFLQDSNFLIKMRPLAQ